MPFTPQATPSPPADMPASELFQALITLPRPFEIVDFPRKDPVTGQSIGKVGIWVLTMEEQIQCHAEADKAAKAILKERQDAGDQNIGYEQIYKQCATSEILARALRDTKNIQAAAFPSSKVIRAKLTPDEAGTLASQYMRTQTRLGPIVSTMSPDIAEDWIRRLGEGGSEFPLDALSSATKDELLMLMASELWMLRKARSSMDTSSPGSPPEGSTPPSPEPTDGSGQASASTSTST